MIIPCMNSTSLGEAGGSVALVDAGKVRVDWPGAPGCTITGSVGFCCAQTGDTNKIRMPAAKSPPRHVVTLIADRLVVLKPKNFIRPGGFRDSIYQKPLLNAGLHSCLEQLAQVLPVDPSSHCAFPRDFVHESYGR